MGIVPIQNRVYQTISVRIGRIEFIHDGLVLGNAQVAIALEPWGIVLKRISHLDIEVKDISRIAIAYLNGRLVDVVGVIIPGIFVIRRNCKI